MVALPFSFLSAENTRHLKMIIIVRGIFRHFSLHEGQEKQPSLGPQFYSGMFTFSYTHLGNMKIFLTMAIVLSALIIVQASSSKEFTLVDTVKNCNCMDYLKWKIWLYSWLSHLSYLPGVPLLEKKRVHHWKDTVRLILITVENWNPNQPFWIPSSLSFQRV